MIPVALDPARARVALAGRGSLAQRRLAWLLEGGAAPAVYAPQADAALAALAGPRLVRALPGPEDLAETQLLFVAGLDPAEAEALAARARAGGVLVNVEDVVPLCDFHAPSVVRRGDLLLTVSTGGRSPALARMLRERLESLFPAAWSARLGEIAEMRDRLRAGGTGGTEIFRATRDLVAGRGWLP